MKTYNEVVEEDRRLAILRVLEQAESYTANESVLHVALGSLGHKVSRDRVRGDLAWLTEQGLISVETVASVVQVATLKERGLDVAAARSVHPGVKRPSPR